MRVCTRESSNQSPSLQKGAWQNKWQTLKEKKPTLNFAISSSSSSPLSLSVRFLLLCWDKIRKKGRFFSEGNKKKIVLLWKKKFATWTRRLTFPKSLMLSTERFLFYVHLMLMLYYSIWVWLLVLKFHLFDEYDSCYMVAKFYVFKLIFMFVFIEFQQL